MDFYSIQVETGLVTINTSEIHRFLSSVYIMCAMLECLLNVSNVHKNRI